MSSSLAENREEQMEGLQMIECERQPCRLRITTKACARRYHLAQQPKGTFGKGDLDLSMEYSLKICRDCPVGLANYRLHKDSLEFGRKTKSRKRRRKSAQPLPQ